ncbi:hypothetical protein MLD38_028357 [Melastoma candidum]|uniref:Uncharacterized protein n=1 Tax=Melastoma candidum TaxID=119954 RepID=A0ACB9N1M4_9MYRT|nr:hypothetical protein MLD38_028357 [Melastoma candidum]
MPDPRAPHPPPPSSSSSSSSSSSPMSNLSHDHLLTFLLLLPADSILSFSSTCKKFRAFACSDALWESVCRREWGSPFVDAIKSSFSSSSSERGDGGGGRGRFSWLRAYEQVSRLDSIRCRSLWDYVGGEATAVPSPRASHSLNFVSDCLVLFGGGCEGGRHLDDTWGAHIGKDFRRKLKWDKVNSGTPSGRFGHTCVTVGDFLVLFGGINDHGSRQNDTWVGQVAYHETYGMTLLWRLLNVGSMMPPARGAHAACCIGDRMMIVHGGIGLHGLRLGDTWLLELSENFRFGTWHEIVTHPSPPARSGHSLTCISGTQTILFGGRGKEYEVLNDIWLLDMSDGNWGWIQLAYELRDVPEGMHLPRVGHTASHILGGCLLIYGGEDAYRHRKEDFWVFDTKEIQSARFRHDLASNKVLLPNNSWRRLKLTGYNPNCRSFHRACVDPSGRFLYIFGGMVDGLVQPAESSGLRFDGELFMVELILQF